MREKVPPPIGWRELIEYNPETGLWRRNGSDQWSAGSHDGNGYSQVCIGGKYYAAHKLAWLYMYGEWTQVDHKNRNGRDNRIDNLRISNASTNAINAKVRVNSTTGFTGVYHRQDKKKKPWIAIVTHQGHKIQTSFKTIEEAVTWRNVTARRLYGDFVPRLG